MAAVTVSGSLNGIGLTFLASYSAQAGLAAQIFAATDATLSNGGFTTSNDVVDLGGPGSILTGTAAQGLTPTAPLKVALGANGTQGEIFATGTASYSSVTTADNSNSSVVNTNPAGVLVATTGSGGNVLNGATGNNQFTTGPLGQDIVFLNGSYNTLTTNGSDAVFVGGPSTITAASGGLDNVLITAPTSLAFINGTSPARGVDSITGASGSTLALAGPGSTSITGAPGGQELFAIDTSAGNTTLNALGGASDTIEFSRNIPNGATVPTPGTANVQVLGFNTSDVVELHNLSASANGSVLTLSDGSSVTFQGVAAATIKITNV